MTFCQVCDAEVGCFAVMVGCVKRFNVGCSKVSASIGSLMGDGKKTMLCVSLQGA